MRLALTGTPCVGKSTVADLLEERGHEVHRVGEAVEEGLNLGRDEDRDSLLADEEGLRERFQDEEGVFEGHLSHLLGVDVCAVLRCHPEELKSRGANRENLEAEALDAVLIEAVEECGTVFEIDTTELTPEEVADRVESIIEGGEGNPPGTADWTEWLTEA